MNIVAIIQARMGSAHSGKVLLDLAGEPMIARVVNRVRRAKALNAVIIATTTEPSDDTLIALCAQRTWPCFRGSQNDVLDRYYQAAKQFAADVVVRITSDCPLIDPEVIDRVVLEFLDHRPAVQYATNDAPQTYPRGLDVEVMDFASLERAWCEDQNPAWREHVTPYLYRHPNLFVKLNVVNDVDYSRMRWTVDTPEDYEFVRQVYKHLSDDTFSWYDVLSLLEKHSDWQEINCGVIQKSH